MKCLSSRGYIVGTVHLAGDRKQLKAHQVVWIASGKSLKPGFVLDHIDRCKTNNSISNLRLVTEKENSKNRRSYRKELNPAAKINQKIADKIRTEHKTGWSYTAIASSFNVSKTLVAKIVRRELWV
jgi:YesN/AraC family two-component response regulator